MSATEPISYLQGLIDGAAKERERIIGLLNRPNRLLTKVHQTEKGLGWLAENDLAAYLDPEPDLTKCPRCGGPADNGHDRCLPPSPYLCTKCSPPIDRSHPTKIGGTQFH